ncbi:MAG: hypothetical protein K9N46_15720 [Candidatus Marinimicrobia bacterium]|nr:hypothetical protein [Candidatus Neomarinimicrobiota bacterium]MCF7830270.1 hypothetical protein [Candidatus Neomarinimicrobiota bacterium]MCF7882179.1 hypothetical protein [Candidatus Neomarinimicrobiota bacterium]
MPGTSHKIFGVGLQRTGTTSLDRALQILGYRAIHGPYELIHGLDSELLNQYDAFTDNPVPLLYQELDRAYPGSKFILTVRPLEDWLGSVEWLFTQGYSTYQREKFPEIHQIHEAIYGRKMFDREVFAETWRRHREEVQNYFQDRPGDLLVLDLHENFNWETLCPFLETEIPNQRIPHRHKGTTVLGWSSRLKNMLFKAISKIVPIGRWLSSRRSSTK